MNRERSIELLNKAVADELQAVMQYMYFHVHLDDEGFAPLAGLFKRTSIDEMRHVEGLAERILFLGGDVDMAPAAPVEPITDPEAMLKWGANSEHQASLDYNAWAVESSANQDAATRQLFERLIADEERHFDAFDVELRNIERFGPSYLALQSFAGADQAGGGAGGV